jgi:predicted AlkP superfamily pyrophosphatase or phosphodiesterase
MAVRAPGSRVLRLAALVAACAVGCGQPAERSPALVLVSFDGWRADYHTKAPTPNLDRLAGRGVRAEALVPAFPAKTFPNHYSLVTGLYPSSHGVVANRMRDPATGRWFDMDDRTAAGDPVWWGGEPIWITAQKAGQVAAPMFWPGSEAPILDMRPRYWRPFDGDVSPAARVDQVLAWLDLPAADRPGFLTLYVSDTDDAGHAFGPDSPQVRDAIVRADAYLGRLVDGLEARGLLDAVNVVVVSDHGMAATGEDRIIAIDDFVPLDDEEVVDLNPALGIAPAPGRLEAVYAALAGAHPRLRVHRREATPGHWRYRGHPRIPPIVGVMDEGWQIVRRSTLDDIRAGRSRMSRGQHGYEPTLPSQHGLFVAAGPAFPAGRTVPEVATVDVYNVLAAALGVTPAPNEGDPAVARRLLREATATPRAEGAPGTRISYSEGSEEMP